MHDVLKEYQDDGQRRRYAIRSEPGGISGGGSGGGVDDAAKGLHKRHRQLLGQCVVVKTYDSYGDGWNGAEYSLINSDGEVVATGTIEDYSDVPGWYSFSNSNTQEVCSLPSGCYSMTVSEGSFPNEVSWEIVHDGVVTAEGGAGETVSGVCLGMPTSAPTTASPTMTTAPTPSNKDYKALSAFYQGMLNSNL